MTDVSSVQRDLSRMQKHPLSILKLSEQLTDPSSSSTSSGSGSGRDNLRASQQQQQRQSSAGLRSSTTTTTTIPQTQTQANNDQTTRTLDADGNTTSTTTLLPPSSSIDQQNPNSSSSNPSPASLASDLEHYRQLFKKLHFSYLEQVTKEKFLRAIVGDPPVVIEPSENAALETELQGVKAELNRRKADVDTLVKQLEVTARELAIRYEGVAALRDVLENVPGQIEQLKADVETLEREQEDSLGIKNDDHHDNETRDAGAASETAKYHLPLPATYDALDARRAEIRDLDAQIAALRDSKVPSTSRQIDRLEAELKPLEGQRVDAARMADEARARKERRAGGVQDQVELAGRWWFSAGAVVREIVGGGGDGRGGDAAGGGGGGGSAGGGAASEGMDMGK